MLLLDTNTAPTAPSKDVSPALNR